MTIVKDNQDGLTWTVTGQVDTTTIDNSGRAVNGVMVSFTTPAGDAGTVFVPHAAFNATTVRAAILAKVQTMHAVSQLNG